MYLDWAATAPPSREIADFMRDAALGNFGNPSSIHGWGEKAKNLLEDSRRLCAEILDCDAGLVRFTSGGTEANNIAVLSLLRRPRPGHAVMSAVEHASVYEPGRVLERFGWRVTRVGRGRSGAIGAEEVGKALRPDTALVAVMLVNNETGMVQPLEEIAALLRKREAAGGPRVHLHADAVQAAGKIPFSVRGLGVDSLSVSAHKFRGPRGVGLLVAGGSPEPLYSGGGQEGGLRPGTENTAGIAAMGFALDLAARDREKNLDHARNLAAALVDGLGSCRQCR
ncbi:MAG: cysteine desulfurase family protein, partial [Desulfococcus multivorans]|nr:cysteine desulfurase family protein [Desulfococcus multivorans]